MGLLEREEHLATLVDRWQQTDEGGRLVLVAGEAGAGKSALVDEFCAAHLGDGRRARVVVGRCDDLFAARPLGPVADIARSVGGELARAMESGERAGVFDAFLTEFGGGGDGEATVVVLEDLQWADDATLDLVRFVARRLDVLRCLVIATYRDDIAPDHPLRRAWGSLVGPRVTRLLLPPLTLDAVALLARGSGVDPVSLHARTAGNPFFVNEVLAEEQAELPSTVRDMVLTRAAHLEGPARDCLDAAAVLGRHATIDLVLQVGDGSPAAVDQCVALGLAFIDGDRVRFRHDLTREAIEEALTPLRRRDLHRRALGALTHIDDPVQRAHHALGAADRDAIADVVVRAADGCAAAGAFEQAAALYRGALEHEDAFDVPARIAAFQAYAEACTHLDRTLEAVAAGDRARDLLIEQGDDAALGDWEGRLAGVYWHADRGEDATTLALDAVGRLEPLGPSAALARARSQLASQMMVTGRFAEAIAHGRDALELADRFGEREAGIRALNAWATSLSSIGDPEGLSLLADALDRAKRAGMPREATVLGGNLGEAYRAAGEVASALSVFDDAVALAEEHELVYRRNCLLVTRSATYLLLDRWDEVAADAAAILAQPDIASHHRGISLAILGRVRARRGDPGVAEALDEAHRLLEAIGDPQYVVISRIARAEAAWLAGDVARAREEIGAALEVADRLDVDSLVDVARWVARTGHDWVPDPEALAGSPVPAVGTVGCRGLADHWAALGCRYEAADVLGDSDDEADLREAHEALVALGARPRAQQVARRLRELGATAVPRGPRPATRANRAGLTRREIEVATLLAAGHTDAEIAAQLVLSPKTVGHHVSSVLGKLGVSSRRLVAEAAVRVGVALEDGEQLGVK